MQNLADLIEKGETALGIELGSTRIKAVLIDSEFRPVASGSFSWENRLENGFWTYSLDDVHRGLAECYADLKRDVKAKTGATLRKVGAIGISAMMHGYLAFGKEGNLLAEFRTWRNTTTEQAAAQLTRLFDFNIPQRWSIAHLHQAVLSAEPHVPQIDFLTTLAGYVHWRLTGERVLGVGDASGMFPIGEDGNYNSSMLKKYEDLVAPKGFSWKLSKILPKVLRAGEKAGVLSPFGAKMLDRDGDLQAGIPLCPPEGDAGTGMVATNSVSPRTGNVSAGTSIFLMATLDSPLKKIHEEIDMVTTPDGKPVAMVHCNNCSSDIDAQAGIFCEFAEKIGAAPQKPQVYDALFNAALEGDADCGGVLPFNFFSGESIVRLEEGRPLLARLPDAKFNLANLMRANIFSALATLKIGLDILMCDEKISLERLTGHGGFFKTPLVGQKMMAALGVPVSVMETAGEGGAWGIAILARFLGEKESLSEFLERRVFAKMKSATVQPEKRDVEGFNKFLARYKACLPVEKAAIDCLR